MSNFDEDFFKTLLKEEREECLKGPGLDLELHEAFIDTCQAFQDAKAARDEAEKDFFELKKKRKPANEAEEMLKVWKKAESEALEACVKAAKPLLDSIHLMEFDLEMSLLRTAILTRATPKGMAKFANESDLHGQLIETLLNNKKIMKEMILQGGAKDACFGNAMKLYTQIMAHLAKDRFQKINKKLAMACALEFASPQTEFDTKVEIDALARFQHYEKAHRKGELDPAFSHFKAIEYRLAISSDAPNEQLQWGRDMLMNFAPHIVSIYDEKWRYNYVVKTDVGYRAPHWTSSPRTYQQVISGGGREGPRAWFGRFICQAFGIPVWGLKQPSNVTFARWTPKGWQCVLSLPGDWEISTWDGRSGVDFKQEMDARSVASEQEYYENVILLECLADACKEKIKKKEDMGYVHPSKVWRSLALMQRKLYADQAKEEHFVRNGPGIVVTKLEKYLETFSEKIEPLPFEVEKRGGVIIPAASFSTSSEIKTCRTAQSFTPGETQLHLVNGEGYVTYELPNNISFQEGKPYMLTAKICSVHADQQPLQLDIDGGKQHYDIPIPYTIGEWQTTEPIQVQVGAKSHLKFYRKKDDNCYGLAIQHFTLTPC